MSFVLFSCGDMILQTKPMSDQSTVPVLRPSCRVSAQGRDAHFVENYILHLLVLSIILLVLYLDETVGERADDEW